MNLDMSPADIFHVTLVGVLWLAFFLLHSFTASLTLKYWVARRFAKLMPAYRLMFNLLSALLLLPILLLSYHWRGELLWQWGPAVGGLMSIIAVATLVAFLFSLRYYDMAAFMGLRQWRERNARAEDQEQFVIGEFHRFVRHPWYTMAIVLIWCREPDLMMLTNAILITAYFVVGSRLEERKLLHYHGEIYRRYRQRVPALLPRPWRYLSRAEARELLQRRE